jgi:formaldehyde-activating enzyme involved in methanogenesis
MAEAKGAVAKSLSGQVGKQLVFKKYADKTVVTKYPDMTGIQPTALKKIKRNKFAAAVAYARAINNDPLRKAAYKKKIPKGKSVYHYALAEYMKRPE